MVQPASSLMTGPLLHLFNIKLLIVEDYMLIIELASSFTEP